MAISAWMLCSKPNEATEIHRRSLALVHSDPPLFWPDDDHLTTQLVQGRSIPSPRLVRQENAAKKKLIRYGGVDEQIAFRRPLAVPRTQSSCRVPGALDLSLYFIIVHPVVPIAGYRPYMDHQFFLNVLFGGGWFVSTPRDLGGNCRSHSNGPQT